MLLSGGRSVENVRVKPVALQIPSPASHGGLNGSSSSSTPPTDAEGAATFPWHGGWGSHRGLAWTSGLSANGSLARMKEAAVKQVARQLTSATDHWHSCEARSAASRGLDAAVAVLWQVL